MWLNDEVLPVSYNASGVASVGASACHAHPPLPSLPLPVAAFAVACSAAALALGLLRGRALEERFVETRGRPGRRHRHPTPSRSFPIGKKDLVFLHGTWFLIYSMTILSAFEWNRARLHPQCTCVQVTFSQYHHCLIPMTLIAWFYLAVMAAAAPFIRPETWHRRLVWLWRAEPFGGLLNIVLADWMSPTAVRQLIMGLPGFMALAFLLRCRVSEFAAMMVGISGLFLAASIRQREQYPEATRAASLSPLFSSSPFYDDLALFVIVSVACTAALFVLTRRRLAQEKLRAPKKLDDDGSGNGQGGNGSGNGSGASFVASSGRSFGSFGKFSCGVVRKHPSVFIIALLSCLFAQGPLGRFLRDFGNYNYIALCHAAVCMAATVYKRLLNRTFVGVPVTAGGGSRPNMGSVAAILRGVDFNDYDHDHDHDGHEDGDIDDGHKEGGGDGEESGEESDMLNPRVRPRNTVARVYRIAAHKAGVYRASARATLAFRTLILSRISIPLLILSDNHWDFQNIRLLNHAAGLLIVLVAAVSVTFCSPRGDKHAAAVAALTGTLAEPAVPAGDNVDWPRPPGITTAASAAAALRGVALGRRLRRIHHYRQPVYLALCWVFVVFHHLNLTGHREAEREAEGQRGEAMREQWVHMSHGFLGTFVLTMIVDVSIAGMLEFSFADVLMLVVTSLARFNIFMNVTPHLCDVYYALAVLVAHAGMLVLYLLHARRRMRQEGANRKVRTIAEMVGVWAKT